MKEDGTFSSESHVPGTGTPGLVANVLPINAYARNFGEYIAQVTYNGQSIETSFMVKATH